MKNLNHIRSTLILHFCLLFVQGLFSQTLTCQSTCPKAGEVFSLRTASPVIGSAGLNKVWNFSVIPALSAGTHLVSYSTATTVPASSVYPQADILRTNGGINTFITTGTNGLRRSNPISANANVEPMELPLPFSYGNTYSELVVSKTLIGSDTIFGNLQINFSAYGSGTLILPFGTYPDVLAIQYKSTQSATLNGAPYGYVYYNTSHYFYSQSLKHPLVYTRQLSESGPMDYGPYTEILDHQLVGLDENSAMQAGEFEISPNPAKDVVKIRISAITQGDVFLRNYLGDQLMVEHFSGVPLELDLSALTEGMYVISFVSEAINFSKKLVLSK